MPHAVIPLGENRAGEAVDVLSEAFHDYPVMRFIIGLAGDDYERRLRLLVGFFVTARHVGDDLVLAAAQNSGPADAVATVTRPGDHPAPPSLDELRQAMWEALGDAAHARYEVFGAASAPFDVGAPHFHLNMIGVRQTRQGQGLSRLLLDAVHRRSRDDPGSCGVSLTTESPENVRLYEHFGYRQIGDAQVSADVRTWALFRSD